MMAYLEKLCGSPLAIGFCMRLTRRQEQMTNHHWCRVLHCVCRCFCISTLSSSDCWRATAAPCGCVRPGRRSKTSAPHNARHVAAKLKTRSARQGYRAHSSNRDPRKIGSLDRYVPRRNSFRSEPCKPHLLSVHIVRAAKVCLSGQASLSN